METFRVRNATEIQLRRVLVPISFGVSSLSLLHILDHHLKTQKAKTRRTGFEIVIAHIDYSQIEFSPDSSLLFLLKDRYPDHQVTSVSLSSVFSSTTLIPILEEYSSVLDVPSHSTPEEKLAAIFNSLPSSTARTDLLITLRTRLLVAHAKTLNCESILWGDSTTRLAEKTLSETAKGRGFSLPWVTGDGESPLGIIYSFPMRDLLKKELVAYSDMIDPPLTELVWKEKMKAKAGTSSKNTTIDDLMKQYFEGVEEGFPSIVSNVVRTTGKLEASRTWSETLCGLCGNDVSDGRFGIQGWGGTQDDAANITRAGTLCYGCTRSLPAI